MTDTISDTSAGLVDRDSILDRARGLLPQLRERQFETEALRRVPDENVELLLASGLNRITVPKRFGGLDVEFGLLHDVGYTLSQACGGTGWCYSLWGVHNWWVGYYPPEAQEEVYADGPDVILSTAGYSTFSNAEPVDGGFIVNGHWQFSSGVDHAKWVMLGTKSSDGQIGTLIPTTDIEIDQESWKVMGLQGTGSKDVYVKDKFVPAHRTLPFSLRSMGKNPELYEYHLKQRRYSVPFVTLVVWDLVTPAVGLAQGILDEFSARMRGTSGKARSATNAVVQLNIAEASCEIDAAMALIHADVEEAQSKGERGEEFTPQDLARFNRDKGFAMKLAVQAATRVYNMAGGHSLYYTDPLQRMFRDVQAASHRDGLVFDFCSQPWASAFLEAGDGPRIY